jgi:SOS-response transcriptional repressor LexA
MAKIQEVLRAIVENRKETQGLTQKKLAELMGAKPAMVSSLLSGKRRINEDWLEKFCAVLGISLGDFEKPTPVAPEPKILRENIEKLRKLFAIPASPGFRCTVEVMDCWLEAMESVSTEQAPREADTNVVRVDFSRPSEVKETSAIDYSDPRHEHDAPREEIYKELPFFDGFRVPAGRPEEVGSDGTTNVCKVVRHLAKKNCYVIRVTGNSMEPRIQDSDLVLVDYVKEPRTGNTVIAMVNGGAVVKKFLRQKGQVILRSTNPKYDDIVIKETDQFEIKGVVLRIVDGSI